MKTWTRVELERVGVRPLGQGMQPGPRAERRSRVCPGELIGEWGDSFTVENLGTWERRRWGAAGTGVESTQAAAVVVSITDTQGSP